MKDIILKKLKENREEYISGEALSDNLGVSRTAVWKCMKELKEDGYIIESSSKKGYKLIFTPDILNSSEIGYGLNTSRLGKEIHCFDVIDSTNNYAKKIASEGCSDGALVVSENQSSGRGRLGREWNSVGKKGIWMSVVLRPGIAPGDVQVITLAASVAVVKAIYNVTGVKTSIKWPNDIILQGKKVCGILTEMSCEMERVNFLVIGIGINVNQLEEDFSLDIRNKAISLKSYLQINSPEYKEGKNLDRSGIIKEIMVQLENQYDKILNAGMMDIIDEWKAYSLTLGSQVKVNIKDVEVRGTAVGITRDGKLIIKSENGEEHEVYSGEISVRGVLGYV